MPIVIEGLSELIARMDKFPRNLQSRMKVALDASLLTIWENVPGYPAQPPTDYVRTGTLGRTLGTSEGGGQMGKPDIYEVKQYTGFSEASFGTRLEYAPYVIGENQASHMHHWWTLPVTVVDRSIKGITEHFKVLAEELAAFLARKGG